MTTEDDVTDIAETVNPKSEIHAAQADAIIKNHVMATMAAATVPLPVFDIGAITVVQMRMIQKLAHHYDQNFSDSLGRNVLTALVGSIVGFGGGIVVASSVFKLVPGVGSLLGMATLSATAGGATYAVGQVLTRHFEEGGSLVDISMSEATEYGKEQFKRGKAFAKGAGGAISSRTKTADA